MAPEETGHGWAAEVTEVGEVLCNHQLDKTGDSIGKDKGEEDEEGIENQGEDCQDGGHGGVVVADRQQGLWPMSTERPRTPAQACPSPWRRNPANRGSAVPLAGCMAAMPSQLKPGRPVIDLDALPTDYAHAPPSKI